MKTQFLSCLLLAVLCACGGSSSSSFDINKKGGLRFVVEVDAYDLLVKWSGNSLNLDFNKALDQTNAAHVPHDKQFIKTFVSNFNALHSETPLALIFASYDNQRYKTTLKNNEVLDLLLSDYDKGIDATKTIITHRFEQSSVPTFNITRNKEDQLVLEIPLNAELPRIRHMLRPSPALGFYETFNNTEVYGHIEKLNAALSSEMYPGIDTTVIVEGDTETEMKKHPLFRYLQLALQQGDRPAEYYWEPGCRLGMAYPSDTAALNRMLFSETAKAILPPDLHFAWAFKTEILDNKAYLSLYAIKAQNLRYPALGGNFITSASAGEDPYTKAIVINLQMDQDGARKWEDLTKANIKRAIAIMLDDKVVSAPTVQNAITNGNSVIQGNFTQEEATDLSYMLKTGQSLSVRIISEEKITPAKK